jgi:transposase InsO family protein
MSAGYTFCLTAVDRFSHWPEVVPILDITANTAAHALLTGWISRSSCPQTITTDQGHQIESQLFQSLARLCGIQLSWMTTHHLTANGLVKCFRRTLKASIMCHPDQQWTEVLPLVLLGIRTAFKEDLQASVAELVYGELLTPTAESVDPVHLITKLHQHMGHLRPVLAACHASPAIFVYSDLKYTHFFLRQDTMRQALEPPYSGPY